MFAKKNISFIEIMNNFMSSFINIFSFLPGLTRRDYAVDVYYLITKIQEKVTPKEVEKLLRINILPKMPDYIWEIDDFKIVTDEVLNFSKEKRLDKVSLDPVVRKPRNQNETKKFLRETFRLVFSQMLNITSEQIALIRAEKLNEKNLNYLKISREFIQTLEFIKNLLELQSKEINKIGFSKRRMKSIMNGYGTITLLFLRMYSISYKIQIKNSDLAFKEVDCLGMERTNLVFGG